MAGRNLIIKASFYGTSLAAILSLSSKLVFACQSVICANGMRSDGCTTERNFEAAQWYFTYSLIIFIIVTTFCLARKGKGLIAVVFCFVTTFAPPLWRYMSGGGSCDLFITEVARWLFYLSLSFLLYQTALWLLQLKKSNARLR